MKTHMIIREYTPADCKAITELFYNTVHTINAKDYTEEQLNVWAPECADREKWDKSLQAHYSIVAVKNGIIVGFGDIDNQLEQDVQGTITTHASITAKDFFAKRGYQIIKEQQIERQGIFLKNYVMKKTV